MQREPHRILYLALADARGHLMRAHLVKELLAKHGVAVDIVTTHGDGARFLRGLGDDAQLFGTGFGLELDAGHNLLHGKTARRVLGYVFDPRRCNADAAELRRRARGYDLVVNDSFHPAALVAAMRGMPAVMVHGRTMLEATEAGIARDAPPGGRALLLRLLKTARESAVGEIMHTLSPPRALGPGRFDLPPLLAVPGRAHAIDDVDGSRAIDHVDGARAIDDVDGSRSIAAIYLNPHFADRALLDAVLAACAARGLAVAGVSETFAGTSGLVAHDARFGDVVARAAVFVSGAGMGACAQARAFGVPFVALLGDQPEQAANVDAMKAAGHRIAVVRTAAPHTFAASLDAVLDRGSDGALDAGSDADAAEGNARLAHARRAAHHIRSVHDAWARAFLALLARAQEQRDATRAQNHVAGDRNEQLEGREQHA